MLLINTRKHKTTLTTLQKQHDDVNKVLHPDRNVMMLVHNAILVSSLSRSVMFVFMYAARLICTGCFKEMEYFKYYPSYSQLQHDRVTNVFSCPDIGSESCTK